jgi:hypothetical protein
VETVIMADRTNAERQRRYRQSRAKQQERIDGLRDELDVARRAIAAVPGAQEVYDRLRAEFKRAKKADRRREIEELERHVQELDMRATIRGDW